MLTRTVRNTHRRSSMYEAFEPAEARRGKLEIHYTPKHGSWLNMAEIEIWACWRDSVSTAGSDRSQLGKAQRNHRNTSELASPPRMPESEPSPYIP